MIVRRITDKTVDRTSRRSKDLTNRCPQVKIQRYMIYPSAEFGFYRASAELAMYVLASLGMSVRLFVRLSVRPSHAGTE